MRLFRLLMVWVLLCSSAGVQAAQCMQHRVGFNSNVSGWLPSREAALYDLMETLPKTHSWSDCTGVSTWTIVGMYFSGAYGGYAHLRQDNAACTNSIGYTGGAGTYYYYPHAVQQTGDYCSNTIEITGPSTTRSLPAGPAIQLKAVVKFEGNPVASKTVVVTNQGGGAISGSTNANGEFEFTWRPPFLRTGSDTFTASCTDCLPAQKSVSSTPCDACQGYGNPIYPASGEKRQLETDWVDQAPHPLTLARQYRIMGNIDSGMGPGWSHNFDAQLALSSQQAHIRMGGAERALMAGSLAAGSSVETSVENPGADHTGGSPGLGLRLLGPVGVSRGGQPVALPRSRKVRALLAFLALEQRPVPRSRLCDLLWDVPNDPRGELRWCLSKLRSVLDDPPGGGERRRVLTVEPDSIALDLGDCGVDALELQRIVTAGLAQQPQPQLAQLVAQLGGELLEGITVDGNLELSGWLSARRAHYRELRLRLLSELTFDLVKVDLSLVQRSASSDSSSAVVESVVSFAARTGAMVIGEGIEHVEQVEQLTGLGVRLGQGFLLGRPAPLPVPARLGQGRTLPLVPAAVVPDASPMAAWRQSIGLPVS